MVHTSRSERTPAGAIWASLATAGVFEALTVLELQDKTVWAASPWREDPYHTVVGLAESMVVVLAAAIAVRLLAWRAPGGRDRARQTMRAAGAVTAIIGLTLAFEWVAVIAGANSPAWKTWTWVLIGGLAVTSALAVAVTVSLVRNRRRLGASARWQHDWLGDAVLLCRSVPVLRGWVTPRTAAWVRRRAMTVFVVLSTLAGALFAGAQAIGEGWTDPLLIGWLLVAETGANLAFCVIGNAVAGFVARPPRTRVRRVAETSVVVGCLATLAAIAFHDTLWSVVATGPLTPPALAALTLGAGLAAALLSALSAALLPARRRRATPVDRGDATSA